MAMIKEQMCMDVSLSDYEIISRLSGIHSHSDTVTKLIELSEMDQIPEDRASTIRRLLENQGSAPVPGGKNSQLDVVEKESDDGPLKTPLVEVKVEIDEDLHDEDLASPDHAEVSELLEREAASSETSPMHDQDEVREAELSAPDDGTALSGDAIDVGSLVTVVYKETGEEKFIEIMPAGAPNDPEKGHLNAGSPLAREMIGLCEGDEFSIEVRGKVVMFEITGVA